MRSSPRSSWAPQTNLADVDRSRRPVRLSHPGGRTAPTRQALRPIPRTPPAARATFRARYVPARASSHVHRQRPPRDPRQLPRAPWRRKHAPAGLRRRTPQCILTRIERDPWPSRKAGSTLGAQSQPSAFSRAALFLLRGSTRARQPQRPSSVFCYAWRCSPGEYMLLIRHAKTWQSPERSASTESRQRKKENFSASGVCA